MKGMVWLVFFALCLSLSGCANYTDHEKEVYVMDAQSILSGYGGLLEAEEPGHGDAMKSSKEMGSRVEVFRRQYVKTPVDESIGMLLVLDAVETRSSIYFGSHFNNTLDRVLGNPPGISPETLADAELSFRSSIEDAQKRLDEAK